MSGICLTKGFLALWTEAEILLCMSTNLHLGLPHEENVRRCLILKGAWLD